MCFLVDGETVRTHHRCAVISENFHHQLETNAIRTPYAGHMGVWTPCPQRAFTAGLISVPSALIVQMLVERGELHGRGAIGVHHPQFPEATAVRNVEHGDGFIVDDWRLGRNCV